MTSGKVSKQRRREAKVPAPPVRAPGGSRQASPKVLIAGAAVLVALIAIGVGLGLAFRGGGSSSKSTSTPLTGSLVNALPSAADVQKLLRGIPQSANVLGSPKAPVTMIEYIDLQCPACQQFETQAMPQLIPRYVRTGKVKVVARPIAFIGSDSERGRAAALAAAEQNRMFNFMELLYFNQGTENTGWLDDKMVKAAASSIPGLDVRALLAARDSSPIKDQSKTFDTQSQRDYVRQTPTVIVGKTGGKLQQVSLSSLTDITSVSAAIETALH